MYPVRPRCMVFRLPTVLLVATLVALAGCGDTTGSTTVGDTLTPVAVPSDSPTVDTSRTATSGPRTSGTTATGPSGTPVPSTPISQPRYLSLRPTCERPPGLVVAIQVGALRNDPPGTHEGIETTWEFATPDTQRTIGSIDRFVDVIEQGYEPLLTADTVTYGPFTGGDGTASLRVTVRDESGATTYRWVLERQRTGPLAGCWLTAAVFEVEAGG